MSDVNLACSNVTCSKTAGSLVCPTCLKLGLPKAPFCSQQCLKDAWATHKLVHKAKPKTETGDPNAATYDPFPTFAYSGSLRACYPTAPIPMKQIPAHIPKPDYASHPKGVSAAERTMYAQRAVKCLDAEGIQAMRKVGKLAREVLDLAAAAIKPGVTTEEIDVIIHQACIDRNAYPSPLNYHNFPKSVCTSVNEVICHGIPDQRPLQEGDIVNLDVTLYHEGYHSDLNATYPVGEIDADSKRLIETTKKSLQAAIDICKPGTLFRSVGKVIEPIVEENGCKVNRRYCGHGIRDLFHCAPNIMHYAHNKVPFTMKAGMCFTIEPMVQLGTHEDMHWPDAWTAATADGRRTAQFEETLLVTETGVEILTGGGGSPFHGH